MTYARDVEMYKFREKVKPITDRLNELAKENIELKERIKQLEEELEKERLC
jgi:hypothetical protein